MPCRPARCARTLAESFRPAASCADRTPRRVGQRRCGGDSSRSNIRRASSLPAREDVVVGEPEAAGEKSAFARRQSIVRRFTVVAKDEAVDDEMLLDRARRCRARVDRLAGRNPTIGISRALASSSFEPYAWTNASELRVEALSAHLLVNSLAQRPPLGRAGLRARTPRRS